MKSIVPAPPRGRFSIDSAVLVTAIVVIVVDQLTKAWISATLGPVPGARSIEIIGTWVRLSYVTNPGAAFGILPSGTIFFTVVALAAVPILLIARNYVSDGTWRLSVVFGLLLGGAIGNLIDRIRLGFVVDFVDVGIGNLRWWNFNVADSSFVVGVIILAIYLSFATGQSEKEDDRHFAV